MFSNFLRKNDPFLQHIPFCLKKWVLPEDFSQIWGLKKNYVLSNFDFFKLKFDKILGINLTELWFQANVGSWGTEKFWNGGLEKWSKMVQKDLKAGRGSQIWIGRGCAAGSSGPIPMFRGNFPLKKVPMFRDFSEKGTHLLHFFLIC